MDTEMDLLRRRYVQKLDDLYGSEREHLAVLLDMAEHARSPALKSAFRYHLEKTLAHVERLNQIFAGLDIRPINFKHRDIEALAQAAQCFPASQEETPGWDTVLISAARKMEHDEISGYLLALRYAQILRYAIAAGLLEQTLKEECESDRILAEFGLPGSDKDRASLEYGDALNLILVGYGTTDATVEAK